MTIKLLLKRLLLIHYNKVRQNELIHMEDLDEILKIQKYRFTVIFKITYLIDKEQFIYILENNYNIIIIYNGKTEWQLHLDK